MKWFKYPFAHFTDRHSPPSHTWYIYVFYAHNLHFAFLCKIRDMAASTKTIVQKLSACWLVLDTRYSTFNGCKYQYMYGNISGKGYSKRQITTIYEMMNTVDACFADTLVTTNIFGRMVYYARSRITRTRRPGRRSFTLRECYAQ